MSVSTSTNRFSYTANGVLLAFSFPVLFYDNTHLAVYLNGVLQASGYTVTGAGVPAGGTVTFAIAPANGVIVNILRTTPLTQEVVLGVAGAFPAKTVEKALDLEVMGLQQFDERLDRAITIPVESTLSNIVIPNPSTPANYGLGLKIAGDGSGIDTFSLSATPFTSPLTTKGDLVTYSTFADRLAVGANGTVLQADSAQTKGLKWGSDHPDNIFRVVGSSDATKKLATEVDSLTTATTRTRFAVDEDASDGATWELQNCKLVATVAANALTVALKTKSGADPSATNPVILKFRSSTATEGGYDLVACTAALSATVPTTATLDTKNGLGSRIYAFIANDAGTLRIGVFNPLDPTADAAGIAGIDESVLYTTVALTTGSDSHHVLYTDNVCTAKAVRILGYLECTQATAGTWATAPTKVHTMTPRTPRSGEIVQVRTYRSVSVSTTTTAIPNDNTVPQNGEGEKFLLRSVTPTSTFNWMQIHGVVMGAHSVDAVWILFIQLDTDAALATAKAVGVAGTVARGEVSHELAAWSGAKTVYVTVGGPSGATFTINGQAGAGWFGGTLRSDLIVKEIFV